MAEPTYGDVAAENQQRLADVRLDDPGEHFPYKYEAVMALLDEAPPMGPGLPGGQDGAEDRSREVADYMSAGIAEASRDFIDAQAAYLADLTDGQLRAAYEAAQDRLVAARLDHRQERGESFTIGAAARRAG